MQNRNYLLKTILDRVAAAIGLVLLLPVMGVISLAILITMGRPIFFRQRRPGLRGKPFNMFKFRTMRDVRDKHGRVLSDFERTTPLSRFLRSASLDELPELINVLRGEMSLVGPRPLLTQYLDRYTPEQARRHEVKPGITGWAQINGRNTISWEEKFRLDVWYVDHGNFWLDVHILVQTVGKVLGRQGIKNAAHEVNMPEFMGSPRPSACRQGPQPTEEQSFANEAAAEHAVRPMTRRWEYGSEFHWPDLADKPSAPVLPEGTTLFGSGCDALRALLEGGMRSQGWRRCHVPAYFCQDVVTAIRSTGIAVELYSDSPLRPAPSLLQEARQPADVILLVNYFGLRGPQAAESLSLGQAVLIEDHTHDPWSRWAVTSRADYCIASLRKTLPLGHGAAVWSPRGHQVPGSPPVTPQLKTAAQKKLAAMLLKRLYLRGETVKKPFFRQLQLEGERELANGGVSGISPWGSQVLPLFPWEKWRAQRECNHRQLAEAMTDLPGIRMVSREFDPGSCPFSAILECETSDLRDHLRSGLLAADIYPAVLWPSEDLGDPITREAAELSRRMLAIHCDFRYGQEDLRRVADVMQATLARAASQSKVVQAFSLPADPKPAPREASDTLVRNTVSDRIHLSPPHMSQHARDLLLEAFDSNWIAPKGPQIDAFEREFAAKIGVEHAVALSSGTAALHLALVLAGVEPGDEVCTSTLTFAATANAVYYTGATPVFVDSEPGTWNLDPDLLAEELESGVKRGRPLKAVLAVDVFGQCADYDRIREVCRYYEIPLIEDAAEALGATYRGQAAGTFGDMACFSFNGNKIITTSGGGMLVTSRKDWADRARYLASQARDPLPHYEHSEVGYNYRMSNLLAAVGRGQLRDLDERVERRRANFRFYEEALGDLPGISFMPEHPDGRSTRWLSCMTVDLERCGATRDDIARALESENIESRPVWKPMHLQPVYAGCRVRGGDVAEQLFCDGLCLPSGSSLGEHDLQRIVEVIRGVARPAVAVAAPIDTYEISESCYSR